MDYLIGAVIALVGLLLLRAGGGTGKKQIQDAAKQAKAEEAKVQEDAKTKHDQRVEDAKAAAAAAILDRPVSGDPVADLADRLQRHRDRRGSG